MAGMAIAVLTTIAVVARGRVGLILIAMLIGGTIGAIVARRVQMTQMPELVAAMHSLVGMAAVLIAVAAVDHPSAFGVPDPLPRGNKLELFIGTFVGAITFSGSVIAFGKLAGLGKKFRLFSSAPVLFPGQHWLNLALGLVMIGLGAAFFLADDRLWTPFLAMTALAFVPGYGLAVARAQHAVKELAQKLQAKGVSVRYAVHPVAGRMPGHMNVLLAEAEVPYDQVFEMEDINSEFPDTDVALVLGANDVVNPLAYEKGSPIYGMPILDVAKARTVIVNKRSMATGYAGLDNPLFYMERTMMVFGDAKKVVEDLVKALD